MFERIHHKIRANSQNIKIYLQSTLKSPQILWKISIPTFQSLKHQLLGRSSINFPKNPLLILHLVVHQNNFMLLLPYLASKFHLQTLLMSSSVEMFNETRSSSLWFSFASSIILFTFVDIFAWLLYGKHWVVIVDYFYVAQEYAEFLVEYERMRVWSSLCTITSCR